MKITKYPQSCVLIEIKDKRILIDPGSFVYTQTTMTPNDWKNIEVLMLTHQHSDHFDPAAVAAIVANNHPAIITNNSVRDLLSQQNIDSEIIQPGEEKTVQGIAIKGVNVFHGPLPAGLEVSGSKPPEVIGFLIDNAILHPGDCIYIDPEVSARVLLLPMCDTVTFSPRQAAAFSLIAKPDLVIPIHYHNTRFNVDTEEYDRVFKEYGVPYRRLNETETIELE